MKNISKYLSGLCLFGMLCAATTSCEDMLSPDSERHSYEVAQDTLYSYWGILKSLQNVAERYVVLGECRGELVSGTSYVSDSIKAILDFDMENATDGSCRYLKVSDFYHVINSCNAYLAMCDRERVTGTLQPYMLKEAAQVEAIRAWTYLQLVLAYREVPFYTEPLLTTDQIYAYVNNHETVTVDNLIDKLGDNLREALKTELLYGMPQYEYYGYNRYVCHSSKAMIPLNLILGDLYLAKGDEESCRLAAQYYYDYLSNNQGQGQMVPGGSIPDGYRAYGFKGEGMDKPLYRYSGSIPWMESSAVSTTTEAITAIPSSTNKLWGNVLRGVNELFGFSSEISVITAEVNDTTTATMASVTLTPQYDVKQLGASEAYFDLCKAQTFEIYIGPVSNDKFNLEYFTLTPDTAIGDARQYWVDDLYQTYSNGTNDTEKFVMKQNPSGVFTTVYPMIYRKSMVWLRYAEALNRAGYPSYAFAILKNGLCNNSNWFPRTSEYAVRDSSFLAVVNNTDTIPANYRDGVFTNSEDFLEYIMGLYDSGELTEEDNIVFRWMALSYENYTDESCQKALYYLDRRELENRPSFLNFDFSSFYGSVNSYPAYCRLSLTYPNFPDVKSAGEGKNQNALSVGIHTRGCGTPVYYDKTSTYNYVDQVCKKAQENYGVTLDKATIYNGGQDVKELVQKCVEDLIVDEEALELAFEGTRFFDLMRVAKRRNDPSYLAKRVARRDQTLYSRLLTPQNWYFPLPKE